MKKRLKVIISVLALSTLSGCLSTSSVRSEVEPYDNQKSLAYNAMKEIEAHYKLKDAERPADSKVREDSLLLHGLSGLSVSRDIFSSGFLTSVGVSMIASDSHGADRDNTILSIDVGDTPKGKWDEFVANHIFDKVKTLRPEMSVREFGPAFGNRWTWYEKSDVCNTYNEKELAKKIAEGSSYVETYKERLATGECYQSFFIEVKGPSNPKLFPKAKDGNYITVRFRPSNKMYRKQYAQLFPDAYFYYPSRTAAIAKRYGGIAHPPIVFHKGNVYYFMKKENENSEEFYISEKEWDAIKERLKAGSKA